MACLALKATVCLSFSGVTLASEHHEHQQIEQGRPLPGLRGALGLGNWGSMPASMAGCSQKFMLEMTRLQRVPRARKTSRTSNDVNVDEKDISELYIRMKNMGKWLETKPSGFGNEKTYDISLEEKLSQEIELDKVAQAAAKQRIKNKGRTISKEKKAAPAPEGIKVWVGNLPKKRNVERDLRKIFKDVQGLLHIEPVEVGDENTRHPLCKGFAFLTFANEDDAKSFVSVWEGKVGIFGKVEKELTFQFVGNKNSSDFKPVNKRGSALSPLAMRDHATKVSMRDVIEAAFQSKKPKARPELRETHSCTDSGVATHSCTDSGVAEVMDPSDLSDLQLETNPEKSTEIEKHDCTSPPNDTGRLAASLADQPINGPTFTTEASTVATQGPTVTETDLSHNSNDNLEKLMAEGIDAREVHHPPLEALSPFRLFGSSENAPEWPTCTPEASTFASQSPTSNNTDVYHNSKEDLEKSMVKVPDVQEVEPSLQALSLSLRSIGSSQEIPDNVEVNRTFSNADLEAIEVVDDKDKRIRELELIVEELQSQLQDRALSSQLASEKSKELALKHVIEKSKPGFKPSTSKLSRNTRLPTETKPSKTKNLQPVRLKKKETQMFLSAASKYAV